MFKDKIKKFDIYDIGLIKFSVLFFTLTIISFSPTITQWVLSTNHLYFLIITIILAIRPVYKFFGK